MVETFSLLVETLNLYIQEAQWTPRNLKRKIILRYIIYQTAKYKTDEGMRNAKTVGKNNSIQTLPLRDLT